ncbi:MAG: hypothetical protein FWF79_00865 [Defluviitaleaceae bacterium]|nr:hypothetical protein [Defluviitaleaceae bacterium]
MRAFIERSVVVPQLSDIRCNSCGRDVDKNAVGYFEDHVSLSKTWGYHSPYDGEAHDIDLCVNCYQNWITNFEIPPFDTEKLPAL